MLRSALVKSQLKISSVHKEFLTGRGPLDILVQAIVGHRPAIVAIENKIDASEKLETNSFAIGKVFVRTPLLPVATFVCCF